MLCGNFQQMVGLGVSHSTVTLLSASCKSKTGSRDSPGQSLFGQLYLAPDVFEITSELQWASSQFFFTWSDRRALFHLAHILMVPTVPCLVSDLS